MKMFLLLLLLLVLNIINLVDCYRPVVLMHGLMASKEVFSFYLFIFFFQKF